MVHTGLGFDQLQTHGCKYTFYNLIEYLTKQPKVKCLYRGIKSSIETMILNLKDNVQLSPGLWPHLIHTLPPSSKILFSPQSSPQHTRSAESQVLFTWPHMLFLPQGPCVKTPISLPEASIPDLPPSLIVPVSAPDTFLREYTVWL